MATVAEKSRQPKPGLDRLWTYDELLAEFPESTEPMELWNGEIIMPPSPTPSHQDAVFDFATALRQFVNKHDLGKVYCSPIDMALAPRQVTQPDVLFVSKDRLGIVGRAINGPADLVAEVISESSHQRDRIRKRDLYEQHGVREYWLIDPIASLVEVLHLESGQYKLAGRYRAGQKAKSKPLLGFAVNVSDILRS